MNRPAQHPASFRDPSGSIISYEGRLYRRINFSYKDNYESFITDGLYERLVSDRLLLSHQEIAPFFRDPNLFKIILPETIPFISYPYEWCFSQLKDAALTTLQIQKVALEYGFTLKDASAFNIQFKDGKPLLIDTLSFEKHVEGNPWIAYRQFCQHFLAPLALMSKTDVRLNQLTKFYINGLPLSLVQKLLPFKTYFNPILLLNIHFHARIQAKFSRQFDDTKRGYRIPKSRIQALMGSLESGIKGLKYQIREKEWVEYAQEMNYNKSAFESKTDLVSRIIDEIHPQSVWDLGANTGYFSQIVANKNIPVISMDSDPSSIETNYLWCKAHDEKFILPLVMDLLNLSPAIGWMNEERSGLIERGPADLVMAFALVHHLAFSNNLPLSRIADFFGRLCRRWCAIEFVPKTDSWARRLLASRQDIFLDYDQNKFEKSFSPLFQIVNSKRIDGSERIIYLFEKRRC